MSSIKWGLTPMGVDDELGKWLNLVHRSRRSVIADPKRIDNWVLARPERLTEELGMCFVAGTTILANSVRIESVFLVDAGSGELSAVYWLSPGGWVDAGDSDAAERLGLEPAVAVPFDWDLAIPLERDAFRG